MDVGEADPGASYLQTWFTCVQVNRMFIDAYLTQSVRSHMHIYANSHSYMFLCARACIHMHIQTHVRARAGAPDLSRGFALYSGYA